MNTECVFVSDFEKVCRICMKFAETFYSITTFQIIDMISSCASVQIWENDELPNQICNTCFLQLQNTINFKQLCEKSDSTFRQIIQQSKVKIENKSESFEFEIDVVEHNLQPNDYLNVKIEHNSDNSDLDYKDNDLSDTNYKSDVKSEDPLHLVEIKNDTENDKQMYECEKCHQVFKTVCALGQHMHRKHKSKGAKCKKCSLICYHPLHLSIHEKTHSHYDFECNLCKKSFSNDLKLKRHKLTHVERTFSCLKCDRSFKDKMGLQKHDKTVHATVQYEACHICGKSIKKTFYATHLRIHGDRVKFSCEICSKDFFKKFDLKEHVKRVHENVASERNHLCNVCGMGFQRMSHLRNHFLAHTKEKPFECDKCDKKFGRKYSLMTHISRRHLNERKHICTFCSQAFFNKDILTKHVRRHTGERPYQCHVCEKGFIQKIALDLHMKVHANAT